MIGAGILRRAAGALLFSAAAFSFVLEGGWLARPVLPRLAELTGSLGTLEVLEPIAFDLTALGEQPPEAHAYLAVRDAGGREGRLFLAYYERAKRWSGRPHDLEGCYAASGWSQVAARRLDGAPHPMARTFEREGERVRVVHWIDHPGAEPAPEASGLLARLSGASALRRDVVSVYLEFPLAETPGDEALGALAEQVSAALERVW